MSSDKPNNFILNGFDRSGTSAISRTLATHPDIEIIMQPFNGGSIRQKLYQIIDDDNATDADYNFFQKLEQGVLDSSYIKSEWHNKYSSVTDFVDGKLHLIKTTQNHLTIAWVKQHFPHIEHWGIWRDPIDTLASLIRNNFHTKWYTGAAIELIETVRKNELLEREFGQFTEQLINPIREMAFILSVRSWFYYNYLEHDKIIFYSDYIIDNNNSLQPLVRYFQLSPHEFMNYKDKDLNIIGKKFQIGKNHLSYIPKTDQEFCDIIFKPLTAVILRNHYDQST